MVNIVFRKLGGAGILILTVVLFFPAVIAVPPSMMPVQDQTVGCDQQFADINLNALTTDPDTPPQAIRFNAFDNFMFDVDIMDGIATIRHRGVDRTEFIGFRATDEKGGTVTQKAAFTVTGCSPEPVYPDPINIFPDPTLIDAGLSHFFFPPTYGYYPQSFFPDNYLLNPPRTCAISTGYGLLQDLDCDGVPEDTDNCPGIFNTDQADQNHNGAGDACDIFIAFMDVQPTTLTCGRAFVAKAQVVNNAHIPFGPVKASLQFRGSSLPKGEVVDYIEVLQPGSASEVELTSRIPANAEPGSFALRLALEYMVGGFAESTAVSKSINVVADSCGKPSDDSFVHVQEIQDVVPGKTAVFPIEISNTEQRSNSYHLRVRDVREFGSSYFDPGSVVIVGPHSEETAYLYVTADAGARLGARTFVLEVAQGGEAEQVVMVANIVPKDDTSSAASLPMWSWILLLAVILAIGLAVFSQEEFKEIRDKLEKKGKARKKKSKGLNEYTK